MKRTSIALVAVIAMTASLALTAGAQTQSTAAGEQYTVYGKVRSVSPSGESFTLWDGTTLSLADGPVFVKDDLKAGSFVRASYTIEGNENVVTSITIRKPFQGGSSVSR